MTSFYDLVVGPNSRPLGKLCVYRERRRGWAALTIPSSLGPSQATTQLFSDFMDHVYTDLFGDFARGMWEEGRVVMGRPGYTKVVRLGDEKNRRTFLSAIDRMNQKSFAGEYLRFEVPPGVARTSFCLSKAEGPDTDPGLTAAIAGQTPWTTQLLDWTLLHHPDQEMASAIDRQALVSVLTAELGLEIALTV